MIKVGGIYKNGKHSKGPTIQKCLGIFLYPKITILNVLLVPSKRKLVSYSDVYFDSCNFAWAVASHVIT